MQVVVVESEADVAICCANLIVDEVLAKPNAVLGLATGSSPVSTYKQLVQLNQQAEVSFKETKTFNLDEYIGISSSDRHSYRSFMDGNLFNEIDINPNNTFLPDGMADDLQAEAIKYESLIAAAGGVDLQLLGLGSNGHIGFNEPSSSLNSRTRVTTLSDDTLTANSRFFTPDENQPSLALTMGIGTILEAKKVVLIATGSHKAEAVKGMVEGPLSAFNPASALQQHNATVVIIDKVAASLLQHCDYYQRVNHQIVKLAANS